MTSIKLFILLIYYIITFITLMLFDLYYIIIEHIVRNLYLYICSYIDVLKSGNRKAKQKIINYFELSKKKFRYCLLDS